MQIPDTLVTAIQRRRAILFAGAGLSCSLGLPLFDVLTKRLAQELGIPEPSNTDFPVLAEYYLLKTAKKRELDDWMRQTWHPGDLSIESSEAHSDIVDLDFPVIYTTNYDSWIERAFASRGKPYRKIVRVADLARTERDETEIIKFHGDLEDPSSIVLTESSFLRRMSLEEPLDIRLRSDSLARPLLFVGYSLTDPNIRYLLYKLRELWSHHSESTRKPMSYIVLVRRDEIQEKILEERGVEPIIVDDEDASRGLATFFRELCQRVGVAPARNFSHSAAY